jgi:hypothetical protein
MLEIYLFLDINGSRRYLLYLRAVPSTSRCSDIRIIPGNFSALVITAYPGKLVTRGYGIDFLRFALQKDEETDLLYDLADRFITA